MQIFGHKIFSFYSDSADEVPNSDETESVASEEEDGALSVGSVSEEPEGSDGLVASELTLSDEVSSLDVGFEELEAELTFEEGATDEALLEADAADELLLEAAVLKEELLETDEAEAVLLESEFLLAYQSFFSMPFNFI